MRVMGWVMVAGLLGGAAQAQTAGIEKAEASVSAENIKAQVKFVSDDLFEGRYPGLRGGELAAKYIATQFALYGLKPAGDNGTYMQQINFVGMKVKPAETTFAVVGKGGPITLKHGDDFVVTNQTLTPDVTIDAPIVFVGYGATAPEFGWDDYAGIDVKGKVVLCIVGDPPSHDPAFFGGDAMTYYGRWTYKFEQAARKGAVGAMIIHRTDLASYGWSVLQNSDSGETSFLRDDANPHLQAASWIQLAVAKRIFEASGMTLDGAFDAAGKKGFKAVELPLRLKAHVASEVRRFQSANVVGVLPGGKVCGAMDKDGHISLGGLCGKPDPDQAVLYTAHYDHLGFVPGMKGDNIYNGAADNGTGVGMLLEMARAWTAEFGGLEHVGPQVNDWGWSMKLPHSVIFAAVTAEEQGLLGSEYLGQHPPVPTAQIALDINYDMLLPVGIQQEVNINGAQRTSFYPEVQAAAKRFGLTIVPDPTPSHGSYYRSDHFSLSRVGIPAFSIDAGTLYEGHDRAWGVAQEKDFNDNHYHNFSDNFDPNWDFRGDAKLVKFGMDLGWQVIHAKTTVEWNKGDEFEAARKASEAAK